jgi:hypothetical protein
MKDESSRRARTIIVVAGFLIVGSLVGVAIASSDSGKGHQSIGIESPGVAVAPTASLGNCTDANMPCTQAERDAAARVLQQEATSTTVPAPTQDEAIKIATTSGIATFNSISTTRAKLVRVGDVRAKVEPGAQGRDDNDQGWAVLVTGDIRSDAGNSATATRSAAYTWWLAVIDTRTNTPVLFDAGTGSGPNYFDSLPAPA